MVQRPVTEIYNVTGPARLTMRQLLETCRETTGSEAQFQWVDEAFLLQHGVAPFSALPLWLPEAENGLLRMNINRALAAGRIARPLAETSRETLAWDRSRSPTKEPVRLASGWSGRAGLMPERETALLAVWTEREGK